MPWAKAGLIIKDGTAQGSAYAAVMVTGGHGVRMQYDFTARHGRADPAGLRSPRVAAADPRRATRITGYESADGTHLDRRRHRPPGRPAGHRAGRAVRHASDRTYTSQRLGGVGSATGGPTQATADFDQRRPAAATGPAAGVDRRHRRSATPTERRRPPASARRRAVRRHVHRHRLRRHRPPWPARPAGTRSSRPSSARSPALIVVVVVGALFITAEYRRGLIRTTLAASPRRGRVLAAKAIVLGARHLRGRAGRGRGRGAARPAARCAATASTCYPVSLATELRVIVGTAALLAVAAVLALALGALLRRSAGAVTAVIVLIVLPYLLAAAAVLPAGAGAVAAAGHPGRGVRRPAERPGSTRRSTASTRPAYGYFPLAPWAGFAVLCGYAAVALGLADRPCCAGGTHERSAAPHAEWTKLRTVAGPAWLLLGIGRG